MQKLKGKGCWGHPINDQDKKEHSGRDGMKF